MIVGGGEVCKTILKAPEKSFLSVFAPDVVAVVDINREAAGMACADAKEIGTFTDITRALAANDIELIVELAGQGTVLDELYKIVPAGVIVLDHRTAKILWDISAARQVQQEQFAKLLGLETRIEKEKHFLRSVFDKLPAMVVVIDNELNIVKANSLFLKFFAAKLASINGKTIMKIIEDSDKQLNTDRIGTKIISVFESRKSDTFVELIKKPLEHYLEITCSPITNNSGDVESILITMHRITERVMLHREIESAEQRFLSFIHSAHDWISIKDREGRYVIVNHITARALGISAEEFIGRRPDEILEKELADTIMRHDREVITLNKHVTYKEIITINRQQRHFNTIRFPLTDYQDKVIGVCTIAREVTKEIKLREQLIQSEKLAAIGKLAAGVAHEINNPLTGILAYAEDIKEEYSGDNKLQDDLSVIIRETLRCRDIVRNLLDFAKQGKPVFRNANLNSIVDNTLKLVGGLPQFRNIRITRKLNKNISGIRIDQQQIQQVLLNLLLNSADAMEYSGEIEIRTESQIGESAYSVSVRDNGPGIPQDIIDKIFEPFFSTKGTNGLGLAVSWGIIDRHGGKIEVSSPKGLGAVFRVLFPVE